MKQNKLMTEQGMKKFEESFWAAIQESAQEIKANGNKGKDKWTRIITSPLFCAASMVVVFSLYGFIGYWAFKLISMLL